MIVMGSEAGAAAASILALNSEYGSEFMIICYIVFMLIQRFSRKNGIAELFNRLVLLSGTSVTPGMVRHTANHSTWAIDEVRFLFPLGRLNDLVFSG